MRARSFCRICEVGCGSIVELAGDQVTVGPDAGNPYSGGYFCRKGRWAAFVETDPGRLERPLVRRAGQLAPVSWPDAVRETGARLRAIAEAYGPRAIAVFSGNSAAYSGHLTLAIRDLMEGLGTDTLFTALSVDCMSRYYIAAEAFNLLYVVPIPMYGAVPGLLLLGSNATVTQWSPGGAHPGGAKVAADIRRRGGWIGVADPVRHQIADMAHAYLPVRPGSDAMLLAGLLAWLWREGYADRAYVERHCKGLEDVIARCRDVSVADAARASGLPAVDIEAVYAEIGRRRAVVLDRGGVCMARHSTVLSGLALAVNASLGRIDVADGLFLPDYSPVRGSVIRGRAKGGRYGREWPSARLADAILGADSGVGGRELPPVKGFIVVGGNPARSLPDSARVERALRRLDLLVVIDVYINDTGRLADIALPGSSPYQRSDFNFLGAMLTPECYRIWSEPIVPLRREQRNELWIAECLGAAFRGETLEQAIDRPDRSRERLAAWARPTSAWQGGMVEARACGSYLRDGFPTESGRIEFNRPWVTAIPQALEEARSSTGSGAGTFRVAGRRVAHAVNSFLHNVPEAARRGNPVLIAPADAASLGLGEGDEVVLEGRTGSTSSVVVLSDRVPRGSIVLSHGWGHQGGGSIPAGRAMGGNANALTSDEDLDPFTAMPIYHGHTVTVRKLNR